MWSKAILCRFLQSGKIPQTQASQGFAAFCHDLTRIPPRHSQTTRATNCANPGFLGIQFCFNCGQTCGQAVFLTTSTCGGSACIVGVSRDCGHGIFRLERGGILLPKQARYQLRYTRIFSFCHYTTARGEKQSFFSLRSFMYTIHIGQVKKAMRDMVSCDKAELPHQLIRKRDHIPHGQEKNTGHGLSAIPDEEHGELRLRVRQPVYPDYFTFRAAFSWSTRSVRSQVTPRSSRPMCP